MNYIFLSNDLKIRVTGKFIDFSRWPIYYTLLHILFVYWIFYFFFVNHITPGERFQSITPFTPILTLLFPCLIFGLFFLIFLINMKFQFTKNANQNYHLALSTVSLISVAIIPVRRLSKVVFTISHVTLLWCCINLVL